jgi:chorismate synthase
MNTLGRLFRVSLLGESHGEGVGALLDGVPAGLRLRPSDFSADLRRRKGGARGTTPRREEDIPRLRSGVLAGRTTGAPLLVWIENRDADSRGYEAFRRKPRPGHADFTAGVKFGGFNDIRGGGHFSGRLTAALVAAGVVAKKMIAPVAIEAGLVEAGGETRAAAIGRAIETALAEGDSIGGIVECRVAELPAGLGEPFFDSAESLLAQAAFSIPAVKGVEFGAGFRCARMRGSEFNDPIVDARGRTATNNAGGINGGLTNGNELVFRAAIRPAASIPKLQRTVDLETGLPSRLRIRGRHDACIALRVPVVLEAAAAVVLADLMLIDGRIPRIAR